MKKQLSQGKSSFEKIVSENCYYIDRTQYIEKLENSSNPYQFFLRPRKFGKSLFISTLQCYYGIEYKGRFTELFGELYIGKNPTKLANTLYVIVFDFSAVDTRHTDEIETGFFRRVKNGIDLFEATYKLFTDEQLVNLQKLTDPAELVLEFFSIFKNATSGGELFILVDEYDHFTNELLSFNLDSFRNIVTQNGFVRKFYEAIKSATREGIVDRFFATGVTPVTLDSMTSGFNIAKNLTLVKEFNEMLGFTENEVIEMLGYYVVESPERVIEDMREYYNGSLFCIDATTRLYNSNMVLYFVDALISTASYPRVLVDINIASDYSKIGKLILLAKHNELSERMNELFESGEVAARLTYQFSFERDFTEDDLISLLFYNGLLTLKSEMGPRFIFSIPNYAIRELYWDFLKIKYEERYSVELTNSEIDDEMYEFTYKANYQKLIHAIERVMERLSNRDLMNFTEKDLKLLVILLARLSDSFVIESEVEVSGKYIDLLLSAKTEKGIKENYLIELKYLKMAQESELNQKLNEAEEQAKEYLSLIERSKKYIGLAIVFVGRKGLASVIN